jgi:LacI family transcriptional regulator
VDGILMNSVSALDRVQQEHLSSSGVPVVLLNRARSLSNFSTVTADNEEGGFLAGQYLRELGHRHLAHLTGARDHGNLRERARGFLRATSLPEAESPVVLNGEHTFKGGYELARAMLERNPETTAVFAANDIMAFGTVRAIMEAGLEIPRDLSIIGFDNVELASVIHPPLTTIHQPKYDIGRAAVEIVIAGAEHKERQLPEHRILGVKLIERQSCAPPRRAS